MKKVLDLLLAVLSMAGEEIYLEDISSEASAKLTMGELDNLRMDIGALRITVRKLSDKLKYVGDDQ